MSKYEDLQIAAELAKETADAAWREMADRAMSIAYEAQSLRDRGVHPAEHQMRTLYAFVGMFERARETWIEKDDASIAAGKEWCAEAEADLEHVGRSM